MMFMIVSLENSSEKRWPDALPLPVDPSGSALYLEKMGEDHLEEALAEMDSALARMLG